MQLTDFTEFFNTYIKNYAPYTGKLFYKYFFNYLHNEYVNHQYIEIPRLFKLLYEDHIIPVEMYSRILLSNGYPYTLVQTLTENEKLILIESFMDYNSSKGTVELISKVARNSLDKFGIYELYIDKTLENGENTGSGWRFVPGLIYKDPDVKPIITDFDYDTIYFKANQYFIDREQLKVLDSNVDVVYPVKSNLLYIDAIKQFNHSAMDNWINGVILHIYRKSQLTVFFETGSFDVDFLTAYNLYYYVLLKKYPTRFKNINPVVSYGINDNYKYNGADITASDITTIVDQFRNISDRIELSDFLYTNVYVDHLRTIQQSTVFTDSSTFINNISSNAPDSILAYIDNELDSDVDKYSRLLIEIKNSFITWNVGVGVESSIFDQFLQTFPNDPIPFTDTFSYKLLKFFKPYHVELLIDDSVVDVFNDRTTGCFVSHTVIALDLDYETSVHNVSHGYEFEGDQLIAFEFIGKEITDSQTIIAVTGEENPGDGQSNIVNHMVVEIPSN